MSSVDVEQRVAILLNALGDEMINSVLSQLSPEGETRLRDRIQVVADEPPDEGDIAEIIDEFDRVLRFAVHAVNDELQDEDSSNEEQSLETSSASEDAVREDSFVPSDDAVKDLHKLEGFQIAGGLKDESSRMIAIVLDCLDPELASQTIQYFPDDIRSSVFSQINVLAETSPVLLTRIIRTTIAKGLRVRRDALVTGNTQKEKKLADMLRNMKKKDRSQIIEKLEEEDAELVGRIRELLYEFEDICVIEDRSLQKLLGEIETRALCTALSGADDEIVNKVTSNLSKRARESLIEEMSLMGTVSDDVQEAARKEVVDVIQRLDQAGELVMF